METSKIMTQIVIDFKKSVSPEDVEIQKEWSSLYSDAYENVRGLGVVLMNEFGPVLKTVHMQCDSILPHSWDGESLFPLERTAQASFQQYIQERLKAFLVQHQRDESIDVLTARAISASEQLWNEARSHLKADLLAKKPGSEFKSYPFSFDEPATKPDGTIILQDNGQPVRVQTTTTFKCLNLGPEPRTKQRFDNKTGPLDFDSIPNDLGPWKM